jgi:thymidylate synthase (FAD)
MYEPTDPNLIPCLDHGFVYLVDHMGTDAAITQAARISYGAGTKSVREDRQLIRYLMRMQHTSPFEQCEVKFHIRLPIFVARQLLRHRSASVNEFSARYSEMSEDFYVPTADYLQPQSSANKQGRDGTISEMSAAGVQWMMQTIGEATYDVYRVLLGDRTGRHSPDDVIYDPYSEIDPLLDRDFAGIARESARTVLPVAYYTEVYWKQDLHNLSHLLKLRSDHHAQKEIRVYADAMYQLIKPLFPLACEAWEDYVRDAMTLSRMEVDLLRDATQHPSGYRGLVNEHDEASLRAHYGLSKRELEEFAARFDWELSPPTTL